VSGGTRPPLAFVLAVLAAATSVAAATSGPPVRVGSTLALTGPLAATSTIHKIAGEISVEQINKRNGFLGRPIEWVLLDDQSKPEVTRTLYERLITVDKVDLIIGPYATGAILSAMAVAQRYQKVLIHHTFGIPKLAKYPMHFSSSGLAFESEKVVPTKLLDALESTGHPPKTIAIVTSKFPSVQFISAGAREVAAARGLKVCSTSSTSSATGISHRSPRASRKRTPTFCGSAPSVSTATCCSTRSRRSATGRAASTTCSRLRGRCSQRRARRTRSPSARSRRTSR
jgi:hypothetical protein